MKNFLKNLAFTKQELRALSVLFVIVLAGASIKTYKYFTNSSEQPYDFSSADLQIKRVIENADDSIKFTASDKRIKNLPDENSIDINNAASEELVMLPGIGEATAEKIIEARRKIAFKKPEDLLKVKGIGSKKLEEIKPYLKF